MKTNAFRDYRNLRKKDTVDIEKREYYPETNISWLNVKNNWHGMNATGAVHTEVEEHGKLRNETRYFITSLTDIKDFADAVGKHWSIGNQLHWRLDVIFREDASGARKDNSPLNYECTPKDYIVTREEDVLWT